MTQSNPPFPRDFTVEELRLELAPRIAANAVFDGWSREAVANAAREAEIDADVAGYAFSGGAMDMIAAWIGSVDSAMERDIPPDSLTELPVHKRIRHLVQFRLEAIAGREEALRRALAIMAMPQNTPQAIRLGWQSADAMWRLAGDTATDYNHYSKRTILSGVYAATLAVFVDDKTEAKAQTMAFLDRRLAGIVRFERTKARLLGSSENRFSLARFLGRLRYPAR